MEAKGAPVRGRRDASAIGGVVRFASLSTEPFRGLSEPHAFCWGGQMQRVILTESLVSQGFAPNEIEGRRRRGDFARVRRGAYAPPPAEDLEPSERHRQLIAATVPQLRADGVISHTSAAVLHGLPVWASDLRTVHLTRPRNGGGGKRRSLLTIHTQPLAAADVTVIDGIPATSLERTVFDLARTLPFDRAAAAGDRALALGMAIEILTEMLERGRRWSGVAQARRTASFIDGRADSPAESVSRVRCAEFGLPAPQPQLPVALSNGTTAYGDLGWPEFRTIGEFDGRVKYEKLLRPGESAADVVVREKRREDLLRALGWQIVRWIWEDLANFGPVAQQLRQAFERGRLAASA